MQIVKIMTMVVACSFSGIAMSETQSLVVPCGDNCSVADLAKIQGQILILKAQEAKETVEKRILDLKNEKPASAVDTQSASNPIFSQPGMQYPSAAQAEQKKEPKAPVVSSIMGSGKTLYAVLRLDDGSEMQAKEGGALPGGYVVNKITLDEVLLSKSGEIIRAANAF